MEWNPILIVCRQPRTTRFRDHTLKTTNTLLYDRNVINRIK